MHCCLQAGKKKDLKVNKDATPSKAVVPEAPVSPSPAKAKNAVPDEFAVVCFHLHCAKPSRCLKYTLITHHGMTLAADQGSM